MADLQMHLQMYKPYTRGPNALNGTQVCSGALEYVIRGA